MGPQFIPNLFEEEVSIVKLFEKIGIDIESQAVPKILVET